MIHQLPHATTAQLREIFEGLDFENKGIIDLEELQGAAAYAEDELKKKYGISVSNLAQMFEGMDDDGSHYCLC